MIDRYFRINNRGVGIKAGGGGGDKSVHESMSLCMCALEFVCVRSSLYVCARVCICAREFYVCARVLCVRASLYGCAWMHARVCVYTSVGAPTRVLGYIK